MIVTIDGPAGAGKSTVARRLAEALGVPYLNSGALYRAVTWRVLDRGIEFDDEDAVRAVIAGIEATHDAETRVFCVRSDGEDVTSKLADPVVTASVHRVSDVPRYREWLIPAQRRFAVRGGCVSEGRDMGSVIFPDAPVKIYLDASVDERARRRHAELLASGRDVELGDVLAAITERDEKDRRRNVAPLQVPEDAVIVVSDGKSAGEVVEEILEICRRWEEPR
jgi:cytidylate kinase